MCEIEREVEYSQGIMSGVGAVILKDGQPLTVDEIVAELKALQARPQSQDGKDNAVQQAQIWAQEARTQKAIVSEIGELVGCSEDWRMVSAVKAALSKSQGGEAVPEGLNLGYIAVVLEDYCSLQQSGIISGANRYPCGDVMEQVDLIESHPAQGREWMLTDKHTGMRISAEGVLGRVRGQLKYGAQEMLKQLEAMADSFYSGNAKAVDQFLQTWDLDDKRPTPPTEGAE
ncbi:hypothetical protein ACTXGQ_04435 [Marinobacter sp. 1Y8]